MHIRDKDYKVMQDITRDKERERIAIANTRVCFEVRAHLLYIPAFDTRRVSTMQDPTGSLLGAAHLQTLGLPSPVHTQVHRLAEAAPQAKEFTTELNTNNEHTCPSPQRTTKRSLVITTL